MPESGWASRPIPNGCWPTRFLVVLLAGALSIPFIHALWYDELSSFGTAVWSLGAIVAFVLLRYLHRMSACWIVHDGAIRIEWLSLKGTTEVETIGGEDVVAIDVESGGRKDSLYVIIIRLHTGKKIRSPALAGKDQAHAVQAEIIRRLGLNSGGAGQACTPVPRSAQV